MNTFKLGVLRNFAIIAENPLMQRRCEEAGLGPTTREEVVQRFGERAALAWDDMNAARESFRRAVDEVINRQR